MLYLLKHKCVWAMKMAASLSICSKLLWTCPKCFGQTQIYLDGSKTSRTRPKTTFRTYLTSFHIWTISKTCHVQNNWDESKIILDFLKGQCISNLKVAKSGKDECFISPNTNVIWIGVEIKVTSYYCSSPLGHEDGSQSACSDDASACLDLEPRRLLY